MRFAKRRAPRLPSLPRGTVVRRPLSAPSTPSCRHPSLPPFLLPRPLPPPSHCTPPPPSSLALILLFNLFSRAELPLAVICPSGKLSRLPAPHPHPAPHPPHPTPICIPRAQRRSSYTHTQRLPRLMIPIALGQAAGAPLPQTGRAAAGFLFAHAERERTTTKKHSTRTHRARERRASERYNKYTPHPVH